MDILLTHLPKSLIKKQFNKINNSAVFEQFIKENIDNVLLY